MTLPFGSLHDFSYWGFANNIFTSWPFFIIAVTVIGYWTYHIGRPVLNATAKTQKSLEYLLQALREAGSANDLPGRYDELHEKLKADPVCGKAWSALDATIIKPVSASDQHKPLRQTVPASEFFHAGLLRTAGANMPAAVAHANMLVGVGLLLTFIGLVLALHAASSSLGSTDPAAVRAGLQQLLAASATKFTFSICGLGGSLAFAMWLRRRFRMVEREIGQLLDIINDCMPAITEQEVAMAGNELLNGILKSQQTFSADLTASLGAALDQSFNKHLSEKIDPLTEAIDRMASSMSTMNSDALSEMIERFVGQLEGAAGAQIRELTGAMAQICEQLTDLTGGLVEVQKGLGDAGQAAARDIGAVIAASTERMAGGMNQAMASLTAGTAASVEGLQASADATKAALAEGGAALNAGLLGLSDGLAETQRSLIDAGRTAAVDIGTIIAASADRMAGGMDRAVASLAAGTAASVQGIQESADATKAALAEGGAALAASLLSLSDGLAETQHSLIEASRTAAIEIRDSMAAGVQRLASGVDQALTSLTGAAGAAVQEIKAAAEATREALREGGEDVKSSMQAAGHEFEQVLAGFSSAMTIIVQRLHESERSFGAAHEALSGVVNSFGDAARDMSSVSVQLSGATAAIPPTVDALHVAASAMTTAAGSQRQLQADASALAVRMAQAMGHLEGLDPRLRAVFEELERGLNAFRAQVQDFVSGTDSAMAKVARHLRGSIDSLVEELEAQRPAALAAE
jgi:hypothetical protein